MTIINRVLEGAEFGEEVSHQGLTMFPFRSGSGGNASYLTLTKALNTGSVHVSEVSEGGSVPELLFKNSADVPVLIVDGEELVGAKQNRVANLTILAPAGTTIKIPVSCVEAGRWRYSREDFVASKRVHFAQGRAVRTRSVSESLGRSASRASDQGQVWRDISAKAERMRAASPTGAMAAIFEQHAASVEGYVRAFEADGAHSGAVFAIGADVVGLDFFSAPETYRTMLPKLVRSYAVDALEHTGTQDRGPTLSGVGLFFERLGAANGRSYPAVGLGTDIRLSGPGVVGGALVVDEDCVHLAAFALDEGGKEGKREDVRSTMVSRGLRRRSYEDR